MDENNLAGRDLPFGNVKNRLELELTLNGEVLDSEMFLPMMTGGPSGAFWGQTLVATARGQGIVDTALPAGAAAPG